MTKHKSKMKTLKQSIHFSLVCFSCFLLTENWLTSLVGWLDTWVAHKLANISPRTFEIIEDDDQDEIRFAHVKEQRISVATVDNRIFLVFFIQKVINGNICFDQKMVYYDSQPFPPIFDGSTYFHLMIQSLGYLHFHPLFTD